MALNDKMPERETTDERLRVERRKADVDLSERQAAIDEAADAIVEKARARADQVLAAARARADTKRGPLSARAAEALQRERDREDEVLRRERAVADETLRAERREQPLPSTEREQTDKAPFA